jgi:hypothetical protein
MSAANHSVTDTAVVAVALAAGLTAGLSVLTFPRRSKDTDPLSRLSRLAEGQEPKPSTARRRLSTLRTTFADHQANRRRTAESARLAPLAADLLAACMAAGSTPAKASEAVATALHPPEPLTSTTDFAAFELASRFREVSALLRLGGNPVTCWRPLGAEPGLLPLSQAAARACLTGAPPAEAVAWTADDLRAAHHSAGTAAARQAGVRSVGPLASCFLPAFLLIGVVPVVIGLAQHLLP